MGVMGKVITAQDAARRLEQHVSRHGCASVSCDLCSDLETCLAPLAVAPAPRSPGLRADVTRDRREALAMAQAAQFDQLAVY